MPTILVSHDIDDVATLADTVAILENGHIAQHGPTAQVLANPLPEVADLVAR
jgi:ABC-type sulfate/molybdate transport systems ATPase subunit